MDKINLTISRETVEAFGTEDFEFCLFHELGWEHEDKLELGALCQNAGWPKNGASFSDLVITLQDETTPKGVFKVTIVEATGDSCSQIAGERKRSGLMEFSLNLNTGMMELNHCPWEIREPDPDEI